MLIDRRLLKNFDYLLLAVTLLLVGVGLAALYSATHLREPNLLLRQLLWVTIGLLGIFCIIFIDYRKIAQSAYLLYLITLLLLVMVLISGRAISGAQRWLQIGPLSFQPSELAKLSTIFCLAHYLDGRRGGMEGWRPIITSLLILLLPTALIILQPDLGTALLLPIFIIMVWVAGAKAKHLIILVGVLILSSPLLWLLLKEYQKARLLVFINPNLDPLGAGYAINQSKIAIGSGGFMGRGWLGGLQTQLGFLPEHHTDFIFSVVGEEWGFLGSSIHLILFFLALMRGTKIAIEAKDRLGILIATGLTTMLFIHVVVNIGMATGIMPVVGLPLPLISYGGSSLLITLISIGILINIGMRRFL